MNERDLVTEDVRAERRHLVLLAYRMLGTITEAEDAVQETYARWYRMTPEQREAIRSPRGWLIRVASRVCLDELTSARARRVRYVGPWLPEPLPMTMYAGASAEDPLDRVTLDESVSTALLLVLEVMTPAERVTFVLHDVFAVPFDEIASTLGRSAAACRQMATSARRRIAHARAREVPRNEHDKVVRAFADAARSGDLDALIKVLDPRAVLRSDGGGVVSAALNPVIGADRIARFLLGVLEKPPGIEVIDQDTADGLGFTMWEEGRITGVCTFAVAERGAINDIRMVVNPAKLSLWC